MTTSPPTPPPDTRLVVRELIALVAVVVGVPAFVVGSFMADPGAGVAALGGVVAGGGYLLGRK